MRICKECGIPEVLGRDQEWNPNGTVTLVGDPNIRMGIYCMEMLTDLVARIEKVVGPPINNMLMEGKRRFARRYIETLLKGPLGFLVKHTKVGAKKAYQQLIETGISLGYGHLSLESYERKRHLGGHVRNPYFLPFLLGDVRAGFEAVERCNSKVTWKEHRDRTELMVEAAEGEDKMERRFLYEDTVRLAGDIKYGLCEGCGVPRELKRFRWDVEKGIIVDRTTDMRFFIMGFNDINAVFTELEEALGDIIPKAVYDANREQGLTQVKKGLITDLRSFTSDLALRGMAHATVTREKGVYRFVLKNPFNKDYLMGRIMGVMEALEGPPGEPDVKEAQGLLEITVTME